MFAFLDRSLFQNVCLAGLPGRLGLLLIFVLSTGQAHAEDRRFDLEIREGRIAETPPVLQVTTRTALAVIVMSSIVATSACREAVNPDGGDGHGGGDNGRALFFLEVYPQ